MISAQAGVGLSAFISSSSGRMSSPGAAPGSVFARTNPPPLRVEIAVISQGSLCFPPCYSVYTPRCTIFEPVCRRSTATCHLGALARNPTLAVARAISLVAAEQLFQRRMISSQQESLAVQVLVEIFQYFNYGQELLPSRQ